MMRGNRSRGPPRRGGGGFSPPVKVGEELDVTIEAVGEKGDGIARKDGFVLFIPGVKEGDQVRVKVTRVLRKVGFAEVVGSESTAEAPAEEAPEEMPEEEAPAEEAPEEELAPPEPPEDDSEDFGEEEPAEEPEEPQEE